MKNLKLNKKLFISYGIVLVLFFLLAFLALDALKNINSVVVNYSDTLVPNTKMILEIRNDFVSIQGHIDEAIAADTKEHVEETIVEINADYEKLTTDISSFKKIMLTTPALIEEVETLMSEGLSYKQQILTILVNAEDDDATADAKAYNIMLNNYHPIANQILDILSTLIDEVDQASATYFIISDMTYVISSITVIVGTIIAIIVAIILCQKLRKSLVIPLKEIEFASKEMSEGRLSTKITYQSKDEFGSLADSMRTSISTLNTYIDDIDHTLSQLAVGNFAYSSSELYKGDFENIQISISKFVDTVNNTLSEINSTSQEVFSSSEQFSSNSNILAQGATEQSISIQQLSDAINEISNQVQQNAQYSKEASTMATQTNEAITLSNKQMQDLTVSMDSIDNTSKEISKIIKAIEDIAFQTNILALNAAVEAARAGAAGKGFAVVADEVRNLAEKSAQAAQTTTQLIESSVLAVSDGVKLTKLTAHQLSNAVESVNGTTEVIEKITNSYLEQSNAISQVTVGVEQISSVIQTNSSASEENAASSEELANQATLMKDLVNRFTLK